MDEIMSAKKAPVLTSMVEDGGDEDQAVYELTADDVEAVRLSREAVARGEIASDEDVRALWAKYGL